MDKYDVLLCVMWSSLCVNLNGLVSVYACEGSRGFGASRGISCQHRPQPGC